MKIWRNPYKLLSKFYVGTLEIKIYGAVRRILDLQDSKDAFRKTISEHKPRSDYRRISLKKRKESKRSSRWNSYVLCKAFVYHFYRYSAEILLCIHFKIIWLIFGMNLPSSIIVFWQIPPMIYCGLCVISSNDFQYDLWQKMGIWCSPKKSQEISQDEIIL